MKHLTPLLLIAVLLAASANAPAEQRFILGNQFDFVYGGTNEGPFSSTLLLTGITPFYGFYPSVDLKTISRNTQLDVSYLALAERLQGNPTLDTLSHAGRFDFTAKSGRALKLILSGSYFNAPDYTSVDVLEGVTPDLQTFRFVFQPSSSKSTRQTVNIGAAGEINLGERSFLTVQASAMSLKYLDAAPVLRDGFLLDQTRNDGRIGYWRRLNSKDTLDFEYVVIANDFKSFGDGRTDGLVIGYSRQFGPFMRVRIEGGPAHVQSRRTFSRSLNPLFIGIPDQTTSEFGFNAAIIATRIIKKSSVSAHYHHSPGDSSGLSSLSRLDSMGASVFSPLWNKVSISASSSLFISGGNIDGSNSYKGFYGTVDLNYPLSRRWFFTWGGSFRKNSFGNPSDQAFKRVYVALRFRAPELWRTSL